MNSSRGGTPGVCFLGAGAPVSAAGVRPYLCRLYGDPLGRRSFLGVRRLTARLLARRRAPGVEVKYGLLGERSPHVAQVGRQAAAIAAELDRRGVRITVFPAMCYTSPFVGQVVSQLRYRGVTTIIGLPQYPHYSRAMVGSCFARLESEAARTRIPVLRVLSYPEAPGLIEAWREELVDRLPPSWERVYAHILFVAPGIPSRIVRKGDPYPEEIRRTARALVRRIDSPPTWSIAYQSMTARGRWLGPGTEAAVVHQVNRGCRHLIVAPIGFLTENLDTLYHLDACLPQLAQRNGSVEFTRIPVPVLSTHLIGALADLVQERITAGDPAPPG